MVVYVISSFGEAASTMIVRESLKIVCDVMLSMKFLIYLAPLYMLVMMLTSGLADRNTANGDGE